MGDEPVNGPPTSDLGGTMDIASAASAASAASDEPRICPFLRVVAADGSPGDPVRWPDEANRCMALGDAAPQSLRQQEYACLVSAHVACPLFARGALRMVAPTPVIGPAGTRLSPAIIGALLVLAASFALSVGFVVANGGMNLPAADVAGEGTGAASPAPSLGGSPVPGEGGSAAPAASLAASAEPSAVASVEAATSAPSIETTPPPSAAPTPPPSAATTPTPAPTSDRYELLKPCPDAPECWIYTVRSGDNLSSIARYFGIPLDVVVDLNPWTQTTQLVAGQELRLPPPTR